MAFKHYDATMTGSALRLSTVLGLTEAENISCRVITFMALTGTNQMYVGGDSSVAANNAGFVIPAANATGYRTIVLSAGSDSGPIKPSDFYVIGTNTEIMGIGMIPF